MLKKLKKGDFLESLLRYENTVFSTGEISLIWGEPPTPAFRNRLNDYVKKGKLIRLRNGIYAKDKNYSNFELAMKINVPAYISFETVFRNEAMIFQYYERIFVASYKNFETKINNQVFEFVRMKKEVLNNTAGLIQKKGYTIASKERAMLDRVYVLKKYYFDNLRGLDWEKVYEILPIYKNKRMEKEIRKMEVEYKKRHE